ncbi:MAG: DUF3822 family protein [Chitinophagaceae bacterium]|nr:DUF3822 family protein [Chitinophagaceae bacterium]
MKQLFQIENEISEMIQPVLSLRIGERHFSYAITNKSGYSVSKLAYFSFEKGHENEVIDFLNTCSFLEHSFYEVLIAFDYSQNIVVPSINFRQEDAGLLLDTWYSTDSRSDIISEVIPGWQLHNVYAVPKEIRVGINRKFPVARYWHQYSLGLRNVNSAGSNGDIQIDFREHDFTLVAVKQSQFLVARNIEYTTPEDVLYYLLQICRQFSLSQLDVRLRLSGLIDKQSSLYKELYQYFIGVEFSDASWNSMREFPDHFFTSLNDLAKCVS